MSAELRQIDSTIDVVTPENISFQYQLAGPFRRLPAFIVDVGIRMVVWVLLLIVFVLAGALTGGGELAVAIWLLVWFMMEWFYGGLFETFWNGQTIGKRMFGMRVLRIDGQPINGLQAVMRNILRSVDMMPLIPMSAWTGQELPWAVPTCLFGLLTPIVTRRYQRLGDLVCGTMVVVEERQWLMTAAKVDDERVQQLAEQLPASFQVTHKLSQALAAYVERRRYLSAPRRADIARHLGEVLTPRLQLPTQTDHDRLLCALYFRTFVAGQNSAVEGQAEPRSRVNSATRAVVTIPPKPPAVTVAELASAATQEEA